MTNMEKELIDSCPRLIEYIEEVGFLPLCCRWESPDGRPKK